MRENLRFLILLISITTLGGFLFGYDTSVTGAANLYIYKDFDSDEEVTKALFVSLAVIGATVGALIGGFLADKKGRKVVIMIADVGFAIGSLGMSLSPSLWILYLSRVVLGVALGMASTVIPIYLSEISPPDLRGRIVASFVVLISFGQVAAYSIALALGSHWRAMLGIGAFPAALQFAGMLLLPESPRFLIKSGEEAKAYKVLRLSRQQNEDSIDREMQEISKDVEEEGDLSYKQQLKVLFGALKNLTVVGIGLQVLQQLNGINTVLYYAPDLLKITGMDLSDDEAIATSIFIAMANMLGCVLGLMLVDNLGRRAVLLWSLPNLAVILTVISICFYQVLYEGQNLEALLVTFFICYVITFELGMGPVPWVVNSEIFPVSFIQIRVRSLANSLSTASNWLSNSVVSLSFYFVLEYDLWSVLIWVIICVFVVLTWVFVYLKLPETKGALLESIQSLFDKTE